MCKSSSQLMTTCRAGKDSETSLAWESTHAPLQRSEIKIIYVRSVFHYLDPELARCKSTRPQTLWTLRSGTHTGLISSVSYAVVYVRLSNKQKYHHIHYASHMVDWKINCRHTQTNISSEEEVPALQCSSPHALSRRCCSPRSARANPAGARGSQTSS